jgi:hypothetical protein
MTIKHTIILSIVSAIAGVLLGGVLVTRHWQKEQASTKVLRDQVSATVHMRALRQARNGETEQMIRETEIFLDGDILGLGYSVTNSTPGNQSAKQTLQKIARYRKEFPQKTLSLEHTKAVEQVLSLVSE